MRVLTALLVAGAVLSGCGAGSDPSEPRPLAKRQGGADPPAVAPPAPDAPPDVVVAGGGEELTLQPWTYCFANVCADGFPPERPADIGSPGEVEVRFPLPDWNFTATFQAAGSPCARRQHVELERTGPTTARLRPVGRAGAYDVTLAGRADGDLFVSFRWTTARAGPLPVPEARLALLADHDGRVDSYGVELAIDNLAASPASSTATITVTAADGRSMTFTPSSAPPSGCGTTEGSLLWDGPDDRGLAAAALGPAPFRYEVHLVLDGMPHVATAAWPDDVVAGNEPSVALVFEPALPALQG